VTPVVRAGDGQGGGQVLALLLDADGVMQDNPADWWEQVTRHVEPARREEFADDLFATETDAMRGRRPFAEVLAEVCGRWGVADRADELAGQWHRVHVDPAMVRLVRRLRGAGLPCLLVTNQNDQRAAYLLERVGYAALFDRVFVSCELGLTKSDAGFFERVVAVLGADPGRMLVVDDSADHVASARRAGLRAVQWCLADGHHRLRSLLADHGVEDAPDA
jgi:putative hydrolase of the HAD superfamily